MVTVNDGQAGKSAAAGHRGAAGGQPQQLGAGASRRQRLHRQDAHADRRRAADHRPASQRGPWRESHTGLRHPERLAGIVALSTYLVMSESVKLERSGANQDVPIFQAHGTLDPILEAQGTTLEEWALKTGSPIPLNRIGYPRDVANLITFLASDDADYMTGQAINISGGQEMH